MRTNKIGLPYVYGGNTTVLSQLDKEDFQDIESRFLIPVLYEVKSNAYYELNVMWCRDEKDAKWIVKIWNDDSSIWEYSFVCCGDKEISVEFDSTGKIVKLERKQLIKEIQLENARIVIDERMFGKV